jgi:WD40 repeat protein
MFFSCTDGDGSYKTFSGHQTSVLYASFCPKGDDVVSCSHDGCVKVFCTVYLLQFFISVGFDILKDTTVYLLAQNHSSFLCMFLKAHIIKSVSSKS